MTKYLIPKPVYPTGIDDDKTLYLVYNSTESLLAVDNEPWSDTIEIIPVGPDESEVWPDNGFGTIDGELFYYDAVEYDAYGKVYKLKKCVRNLGGEQTRYNSTTNGGTQLCPKNSSVVRGMVVAQHHNQMVDVIHQIERFVGYNYDPNVETLDYRIRCLREVPICVDDVCVTIQDFSTTIVEDSACTGVHLEYNIDINETFQQFTVDFGDGQSTSTELTGTHIYAPGAKIDPVLVVTNPKCQIVQTPPIRLQLTLPEGVLVPPFELPIPECPPFPPISVIECSITPPEIVMPPILLPCISISPMRFPSITLLIEALKNLPTMIHFGPVNIPSIITITPPNIPSIITITPPNIPSIITVVVPPIPSIITVVVPPIPSIITIIAPVIPSIITLVAPPIPTMILFGPVNIPSMILFAPLTIPSMILFGPVTMPSMINFGPVTMPSVITFGAVSIPSIINFGPVSLPSQITFGAVSLPSQINFGPVNIPSQITFGPVNIPSQISVAFGEPPQMPSVPFGEPPPIPSVPFGEPPPMPSVPFGEPPPIPSVPFGEPPPMPSIEIGPPPEMPSVPFGEPPEMPSISIGPPPSMPSIEIGECPPCSVTFGDPPEMPSVPFGDPPPMPSVTFGEPPPITVTFDTPPPITGSVTCTVTVSCPGGGGSMVAFDENSNFIEGRDFNQRNDMEVPIDFGSLGIPSEIKVIAPTLPRVLVLEHDLPNKIEATNVNIPSKIEVFMEASLPSKIEVSLTEPIPDSINLVIPEHLKLQVDVPRTIELIATSLPEFIKLAVPDHLPNIAIDASGIPETIKVVGCPETITLVHNLPSEIFLRKPDDLKIDLVQSAPLDINVNVQMNLAKLVGATEEHDAQCVMIVPCPKK